YRSSLPETPTHKKHSTGGRASAESTINQKLRAAATHIRRACAIRTATGNNVEFDVDALAELKQAIELLEKKQGVRLTKQPVNTEEKRQAVSCEPADGFCARCESEGHAAETCPMPDDKDTRRIAEQRRERRQRGVVEPSGGVVELCSTTPPNTQENQQDTESAETSPPDSDFSPDVLTDDDYTQHDGEFWQCVQRHVVDGKDRNHAVTLTRDEIGTISDWYARRHAKGGSDGWIH
ncbi:MAG: hypothetical protein M3R15_16110, partial [Acidobacteriota bacterium]|nr:hypothetical protein [Acidobacteriota bacterium]